MGTAYLMELDATVRGRESSSPTLVELTAVRLSTAYLVSRNMKRCWVAQCLGCHDLAALVMNVAAMGG